MVSTFQQHTICYKQNLIDFAIEIITFLTSERQTTSYLWTVDRTYAPKGQVAVQNSLQERTNVQVSLMKIVENSIRFSTLSYSATQQYLEST